MTVLLGKSCKNINATFSFLLSEKQFPTVNMINVYVIVCSLHFIHKFPSV